LLEAFTLEEGTDIGNGKRSSKDPAKEFTELIIDLFAFGQDKQRRLREKKKCQISGAIR
jgi:hypothetical protein